MEKMTLIKSQVISIPHQLQRGLPGIFSVKQVTKVFCGLLKIFRIAVLTEMDLRPAEFMRDIIP